MTPDAKPMENEHGCYCPDCGGSWENHPTPPDGKVTIHVCGCPCHEEDEHDEDAPGHDDTCDCDDCCGDDEGEVEHSESGPVPGCNCHDCIR